MTDIFEINYKRLIVLLLPTFLRKSILYALLKSLIQPVIDVYDTFLKNRTSNLYKANINGQVCYLRKMLNDNFDSEQRRIYIAEGLATNWIFAYKQALFNTIDNKEPLWAGTGEDGTILIPKQGSLGNAGLDFLIMLPVDLLNVIDEKRLTALVNYYKLASKRYSINYFV